MKRLAIFAATVAATALAAPAFAQTAATATTDLNVRSGPGPQYPVVGVIGAGQATSIDGCVDGSKWCRVAVDGKPGWAYSDYLTGDFGGKVVVMTDRPGDAVPVVTYEEQNSGGGAVAGAAAGAVAGALIAGPIGAVVGGVAGATVGGTAEGLSKPPPEQVVTYVRANQGQPVYLDGEVVVGAGLPESVALAEVPDYEYRYVYVNGQPVLVDAGTRKIVYIVR